MTDQPTKRLPGRPPKGRKGKKVNFYLTNQALEILARLENQSAFVSAAIIEKYEREAMKGEG